MVAVVSIGTGERAGAGFLPTKLFPCRVALSLDYAPPSPLACYDLSLSGFTGVYRESAHLDGGYSSRYTPFLAPQGDRGHAHDASR